GQATLDVELRYHRGEACLDLVRFKPALIELLEFLQIRFLFSQKAFRKNPTLVRRGYFRTDERNGAALVVFANPFARTGSADTRTNDEIIAPNHIRKFDDNFSAGTPTREIVKDQKCSVRAVSGPPTSLHADSVGAQKRRFRRSIRTSEGIPSCIVALSLGTLP